MELIENENVMSSETTIELSLHGKFKIFSNHCGKSLQTYQNKETLQ